MAIHFNKMIMTKDKAVLQCMRTKLCNRATVLAQLPKIEFTQMYPILYLQGC